MGVTRVRTCGMDESPADTDYLAWLDVLLRGVWEESIVLAMFWPPEGDEV